MNKSYIGVSGFARSGKNLFCDIAQKVLKEKYNLTSKTYALAYFLKKDCEPFIQEKLGLSAFSEKTEDKNAFREIKSQKVTPVKSGMPFSSRLPRLTLSNIFSSAG